MTSIYMQRIWNKSKALGRNHNMIRKNTMRHIENDIYRLKEQKGENQTWMNHTITV